MPYVEVDVDLDDFDTYDLVEELCRRIKNHIGRKSLSEKDRQKLKESFGDLGEALKMPTDNVGIEIKTLDDTMKYEHLIKIFHKYSTAEIERLLPEY